MHLTQSNGTLSEYETKRNRGGEKTGDWRGLAGVPSKETGVSAVVEERTLAWASVRECLPIDPDTDRRARFPGT
jgi:hypothetical protein